MNVEVRSRQLDLRTAVLGGAHFTVKPLADRQKIRSLPPQRARRPVWTNGPDVTVLDNGIAVPSLMRLAEAWVNTWLAGLMGTVTIIDNGCVNHVRSLRDQKLTIARDGSFRDPRNGPIAPYRKKIRIVTDSVTTHSRRSGVNR
jgi:hypothetical protein